MWSTETIWPWSPASQGRGGAPLFSFAGGRPLPVRAVSPQERA